jgi:hypothetical protein
MTGENEPGAYISGFHLDALTSGVPLNVDLDTTLTVTAGNLCRLLARKLTWYQTATPDKIWRHFLDATGTLHITPGGVTCALNLRSHHPVLIDGGFADLEVPIPLVGRPHPALPVPATLTSRPWTTSTQLPHRESSLARDPCQAFRPLRKHPGRTTAHPRHTAGPLWRRRAGGWTGASVRYG